MTTKCTGLIGRIFGHKFRPVITYSGVIGMGKVEGTSGFVKAVMDKHRNQTYHHSVCQRCGAVTGEKK